MRLFPHPESAAGDPHGSVHLLKHVLVTGSTGFIGRRLIAHIRERWPDASIAVLIKAAETPSEAAAFSDQKRDGLTVIFGDLAQPHVTEAPAPEVDVLFHLAANIDTAASEAGLTRQRHRHDAVLRLARGASPERARRLHEFGRRRRSDRSGDGPRR